MKLSVPIRLASLACLFLLTELNALADILPGAAQPETVSKALTAEQPKPQPTMPSVTTPKQPTETPGGEAAKKIKFQLNGIILEGNRVYTDAQLSLLYKNKLHKTITVAELFEIVQAITNYYRNNGYVISRVILPPQHVKGGIVKVQIIEGFIDKVDVSGTPYCSRFLVLGIGCNIKKCRPLEIKRMEHYLLIANEIPGTSVKAVLSPSKKTTGAADLTLVTENRRFTGYSSYDNYGTRYIGPQQMTANTAFNSIITPGDATNITYTRTPKGAELTYYDINYFTALNTEGMRWQIGSTTAHTRPQFVLKPAKIDGLNLNYYTALFFPRIRERTKSLTYQLTFNYLDSYVTTFDHKLYTDHIRSLGAGFNYNFSDSYYGANLIFIELRQGLPIMGYSQSTNLITAETSRPGGRANYTKFDGQFSRLQAVKGAFTLYGVIKWQYAFQPLLAAEQYTFGGSQLGRGYDVAELIGDQGIAGSLEARYDYTIGKIIQNVQFYGFYDAGQIWNFENIPGTPMRLSATCMGVGIRFFGAKYVSGNLMWTQVLTKPIAAEKLIGDGTRPRVFFSIVAAV